MRIYLLLAIAAGVSFIGSSCGGSGVGDPCVPEDEYLTGFSGFSQSEVNIESRSFQCLTRICLVNHFDGRVSCPYGQVEDPNAPNEGMATCMGTELHRNSPDCQPGGALHMQSCQVPTRDGSFWGDRIVTPVSPQLVDRQAIDAVYCSCRCADADGNTKDLCECPAGFACEELVEDLGLGAEQLAGSYCVKANSHYDPASPSQIQCRSGEANCNDKYNIEDWQRDSAAPSIKVGRNQRNNLCMPRGATCESDDTCCVATATGERITHTIEGEPDFYENLYTVERIDCPSDGRCPY